MESKNTTSTPNVIQSRLTVQGFFEDDETQITANMYVLLSDGSTFMLGQHGYLIKTSRFPKAVMQIKWNDERLTNKLLHGLEMHLFCANAKIPQQMEIR